jgi:hypothetical protein
MADVKAAIIAAFDDVGGKDYLRSVAASDPRTFCALLRNIVPTQVTGDAEDGPSASHSHGLRHSPADRYPRLPAPFFAAGGASS